MFTNKPKLEKYELLETKPIEIKARDGLILPSYLTRPNQHKAGPTIIMVHGGPNSRDHWGYDPET
jgi:dipeptidyl aminopeptidase/acylaminoacyl peptidase